jgi:hypothetical protein
MNGRPNRRPTDVRPVGATMRPDIAQAHECRESNGECLFCGRPLDG